MVELNVNSARISNMSNNVADVEIGSINLDRAGFLEETQYTNSKWPQQLKIYKSIPEFKIALDMRAIWTVGKEIEADDALTQVIIDHITGWGKDTFRNILKNMIVCKRLGQDAYAEIIRSEDRTIINLKPLDSGNIRQVYNKKGIIKRYEQLNPITGQPPTTFKPEEILHLTNKRIGDEIHGVADSEALEDIIKAAKESFDDMRKLMHRWVKPMMKFILDTDDETKINSLVAKFDSAVNKGENLYIPKGSVEQELIAVPSNATLNPLPWREHLRNYFFQVVGMPQIVLGSSGEFTESTAKIAYLAFEQSVEDEQTDIEEQIWDQLQLRIHLNFPASLKNEMLSDESKDGEMGQMNIQPNEVTAGSGR